VNKSLVFALVLFLPSIATAQESKSLASTLDVYAFPKEGQTSEQQSKDESECYQWAVTNSGNDPFEEQKQAEASAAQTEADLNAAQSAGQGSGARGAVKGAAAGALIGGIADNDVSNSAGWGAAAGLIHGRRQGQRRQQEATYNAAAQGAASAASSEENIDNFRKAFSACLEAKDYMVKY